MKSLTAHRSQRWLILILFFVQFCHICDFVMMMPLGPQLMRVLGIDATGFAILVSAYTFSAGVIGFMAALVVDRFNRKWVLISLYVGFLIGTVCCALAETFEILLLARLVTGAFGGTLGATVFAIVGDVVPESHRGRATGVIMSAFPTASVAGVPIALTLADQFHWSMPFYVLAAFGSLVFLPMVLWLPDMSDHITEKPQLLKNLGRVLRIRNHHWAFLLGVTIVFPAFMVVPFISPYMVSNVGILESELAYIYLIGGLCTFFSARWLGRLSDRFGARRVFPFVAGFATLPLMVLTHLPPLALWQVVMITTVFMMSLSGRMIPGMHMITSSAERRYRGSFLSVNASIQQLALGMAALLGGKMVVSQGDGSLLHYDQVGFVAVGVILLSLFVSRRVKQVS